MLELCEETLKVVPNSRRFICTSCYTLVPKAALGWAFQKGFEMTANERAVSKISPWKEAPGLDIAMKLKIVISNLCIKVRSNTTGSLRIADRYDRTRNTTFLVKFGIHIQIAPSMVLFNISPRKYTVFLPISCNIY